ncbi:D-amino-acid transaminase [Methylocapsa sp. S129]|uniref:D-amino-acid transaminase n=1 Tax=Methylocapsa sp. S129 TaxID=1641869 RepID=UPI00131E7EA7|nr:D-amino-acid transaminase [Methylocapsa sp. S129]
MPDAADRIVFLNGAYVPLADANISIMDRGFLFADGIYEVSAVLDGKLVDNDAHLARLKRSLAELRIAEPYSSADWIGIEEELIRRNSLTEGVIYIEVTRGVAERDFVYPPDLRPTVVAFTQVKAIVASPLSNRGAKLITLPDLRWARRDIKSVALLAQVLAKQTAAEAGAAEAWMVEDGFVTEGGSSTAFIITQDMRIITRPLSTAILPGITRLAVMRLAARENLTIDERPFSVVEAKAAAEVFYTSASNFVVPVISVDGDPIGNGQPGPLTRQLRDIYIDFARGEESP